MIRLASFSAWRAGCGVFARAVPIVVHVAERARAYETERGWLVDFAGDRGSRLEARWAAFFDVIGVEWTYEPFDAAGYIPDFLCRDACGAHVVEVKGLARDDPGIFGECERARRSLDASGHAASWLYVVGCDPAFGQLGPVGERSDLTCVGGIGACDLAAGLGAKPAEAWMLEGIDDAVRCGANLRTAWGEAHETARWMPVEVRT